eukprot:g2433.t1
MWGDPRDGKLGHGIAKDSAASNDNDAVGINDDEFFTTLWPQPVLFFKSNERRIKFVSCGADHTLCLDDNGGIYSWGLGNYGNLGHGDTKNQIKPRLIESLKDSTIAFTAAGSKHSLGMSHSGIVYTWGHGDKGRLGNGDRRGSLIPEENAFFNSSAIRAVQGACGEAHTAVVGANGTLYTFGSGSYGRLGHGEELDVFVPKLVDTLQRENIAQVACGAFHTVILTSNGMIFSCGSGRYGQLGHDGFADGGMPNFLEPSLILEGGEVEYTLVACGTFHTIALTSDKKVRSWGFGGSGRLGHAPKSGSKSDSTLLDEYFKPTTILTLKNVDITGVLDLKEDQNNNADQEGNASTGGGKTPGGSSIAYSLSPKAVRMVDCGEQHTLMLTQSGHVWAWGNNSQGQLGIVIANSKRNFVSKPEQLTQSFSVHTMAFIAAGNKHSMAVTASGDVFTWGRGKEGQLGLGGSENKSEPQIVSSLQGRAVVFAAGGECMSAVIVEDGSLYTWGAGDLGKLGQGSISANQRLPRMVRGALLNEVVVQVSLGFEHSGCVTESGKLFTWGGGWFGRLGIGHTENQYTPVQVQSLQYKKCLRVSCGAYHTLAVTKQADLYSWGKASSGLGYSLPNGQESALLPQRVNHFKQIMESVCFAEAAYDHSIVITGKGHVHTFGKGKYGKLGSAFNLLDDEAEEDVMVPTVTRDLYGTHKEFQVGDVPWRDLSDEVRCVRAFTNHCVALTVKGDIYTWGNGGSGRLGHGTQKKEICPREVLHLPGVNDKKRKEGMEMYKTARKSAARLKKASPMNTSNLRNAARLARQQGRGGIVDGGSTGAAGGDAWGHGQAQGRDISGRSGQSNEGDPAKGIQGSGPGDGSGDGMGGKGRGGLDGATGLGQTEKRADGTTGDDSLGPMASNDMFNRGDKEALASQDVVTELAEGGSLSGDMQAGDGKGDLQTTLARAVAESQKDGAGGDNDLAAQDGAVDIGGQSSVVEDFQILGQIPSAKYVQNKLELEKPEYSENNLTKLTNFSNRKRSIVCDHLVRCERLEDEISTTMYNIKWTVNAIVQTHDSGKDNRWATPRDVHARRLAIPVDIVPQKGNLERIFSLLRVQPNYLLGIYNYFIAANRDADTNVQHVKRFVDLVINMKTDLVIDMYREHLRPIENFTESIGLSNIKYVRYVLYKCVKVITSGRDDPMHKYVRGVNGLTYNLEDQKEAENFVRQCDYLDDSGIGLGLPEQYAVNITFHTRLMTTSGVEKLRAYEKSRSDEAQQDSRKFDSQGNKAEDSEFESIETIGDIIASPDDPTDDDENVARDQQNVVALFTDSRNGVPLPSYLATADATLLSHEKANGGMLLNKQQIAVREVIKQMEDLTESLADSAKLRRLLMKKIREQQVKDPESRNWDMQTNYRLAYDFLKSLPGSIDQLFGAFLLDIEERKNAGDMIVHELQYLSKPPSLEKLLLGRKNIFRGSFRCFSYMEMQQKDIVVMVDVTGLQDNHNEDKAEKNGEDIRKRVHYTFASKRPGVFLITTSYDKDFVLDVFSVETGQTVKLKNAMIRTWRPLGSQSTFIVSNLLELLQELTMKKLLLDFHPNKASK